MPRHSPISYASPYGPLMVSPHIKSSQLTDLLEQSILESSEKTIKKSNRAPNLAPYYKRSVKPDRELTAKREVMIKNYRLLVTSETSDQSNGGITVSNSVIRPEKQKFDTHVSDKIAEDFLEVIEDRKPKFALRLAKARNFSRRTKSVLPSRISDISDQIFGMQQELPEVVQMAQLLNEEESVLREETISM